MGRNSETTNEQYSEQSFIVLSAVNQNFPFPGSELKKSLFPVTAKPGNILNPSLDVIDAI